MIDELFRDLLPRDQENERSSDVVFLLLLCTLAFAAAALVIDVKSAGVSLFAEGSALSLGVVLAFTIGSKLLLWDRQRRWQNVREQLGGSVADHIVNLAREFELVLIVRTGAHLPPSMKALEPSGASDPARVKDSLRTLLASVNDAVVPLSKSKDPAISTGAELLDDIAVHIKPLLTSLLSRAIAVVDDPRLIEPLFKLERSEYKWRRAILDVKRSAIGDTEAWDAATATLAAAVEVYDAFYPSPTSTYLNQPQRSRPGI